MKADSYTLCEDGTITCPNGSKAMVRTFENRHPKKKNPCSMSSKDALDVPLPTAAKCSPETKTRTSKSSKSTGTCRGTDSRRRTICFPSKGLKSESTEPFGSKALQDYGRERLGRRRLENVSTEVMLNALGMNIAKLFRCFETGKQSGFWMAPENLKPEKKGKTRAKRLSKTAGEFMTERTPNKCFQV